MGSEMPICKVHVKNWRKTFKEDTRTSMGFIDYVVLSRDLRLPEAL